MQKYFFIPFTFLCGLLAACGGPSPEAARNEKAADFALPTLSGGTAHLESLKGRVVLLDFWSMYCEPCEMAAPVIEKIYRRHRDGGLSVIGINVDGSDGEVAQFAAGRRISYPVALDLDGGVRRRYGIMGIPTLILIDKNGMLRRSWFGFDFNFEAELDSSIQALLQEPI